MSVPVTTEKVASLISRGFKQDLEMESAVPDGRARQEQERVFFDIERETSTILKHIREDRNRYAPWCFFLVVGALVWILAAATFGNGAIAFFTPDGLIRFSLNVPESVLIAMLGGFWVAIIGLFRPVMKYLFPDAGTKINLMEMISKAHDNRKNGSL